MNARAARSDSQDTRLRWLNNGQLFRLCALWFALEFFWGSQQIAIMPDMVKAYTTDATIGFLYGLVKAAGAVCVMAVQLSVGFISDHSASRLGRRRPFILAGIVSGCAAITLFMLAPGYWWMFAAYLLVELTINIASIPFQSLLPDLVPEVQHAQAGSTMGLLHMLGYLVSSGVLTAAPFIAGDKLLAYRTVLLPVFIVLLLTFTAITVLGVDEFGWRQVALDKIVGKVRTLRILPGTAVRFAATAPTLLGCILNDYRKVELLAQRSLMFLWLSRFTVFLGYASFIQYAKLYIDSNLDWQGWLQGLGVPAASVADYALVAFGSIIACFVLGGLIGSLVAGPLAQRHGKKAVIGAGMILSALTTIPFILTRDFWFAVACGTCIGCGWGAFIAADWAFACTLMPKQKAGSYMGIWDVSTLLPQVISPVIAGLIYQLVYAAHAGGGRLVFTLGTEGVPAKDPVSAALGFKCVILSLPVYFALGLLVLRHVKEPPLQRRDSAPA